MRLCENGWETDGHSSLQEEEVHSSPSFTSTDRDSSVLQVS
jgi:hypothetical protein